MKYKYSVISDNTQENREWLEKVGYVSISMYSPKDNFIVPCADGRYYSLIHKEVFLNTILSDEINCIGNSPLFKAVSAMREDSDFGQLFECKDGLLICQYPTSREHINKECKGWDVTGLKKYTLTELQERFKEKER